MRHSTATFRHHAISRFTQKRQAVGADQFTDLAQLFRKQLQIPGENLVDFSTHHPFMKSSLHAMQPTASIKSPKDCHGKKEMLFSLQIGAQFESCPVAQLEEERGVDHRAVTSNEDNTFDLEAFEHVRMQAVN